MKKEENLITAIEKYGDMLFQMAVVMVQNIQDAEDIVQETYIRYMNKAPEFKEDEYEKAWLIKVCRNICKDMCRFRKRNGHFNIDEYINICNNQEIIVNQEIEDYFEKRQLLEIILQLPFKYREIIVLHYIEGYKIKELSKILHITEAAVKKRLQYGRKRIKDLYENEGK